MKYSNAAVNYSELDKCVEIGDDARDDPGYVEDVKNRDGDKAGCQ